MKKIIIFLIFTFTIAIGFSQNYIGKNMNQIIISELFSISPDSIDVWEKKNVFVDLKDFKSKNQLRIHDVDNNRIVTCIIENEICTSFTITYYSINKSHVEYILGKKYDYDGNESWFCCDHDLELHLKEEPGKIFIIEEYNFISNTYARTTH